jgi:hypothetical protein
MIIAKRYLILILGILFLAVFLAVTASAQEPLPKYLAFGFGLSQQVPGTALGWAAFGIPVAEKTISYTDCDIFRADGDLEGDQVSFLGKRYLITIRTGLAFRLLDLTNRVSIWGLGDFGVVNNGSTVASSVAGGGFLSYELNDRIGFMAVLQADRSSMTGTDFKPRFGVTFNLDQIGQ